VVMCKNSCIKIKPTITYNYLLIYIKLHVLQTASIYLFTSGVRFSRRGAIQMFVPLHFFTFIFVSIYTVNHKTRATLFSIITLAFLFRFLYFFYR